MSIQFIIVILVLAAAIAYAGYRLTRLMTGKSDPCAGCQGCDLKRQLQKKGCKGKGKNMVGRK